MKRLNGKEQQLLRLKSSGLSDAEIASSLKIGPVALAKRLRAVCRKMGVKSPDEAVRALRKER